MSTEAGLKRTSLFNVYSRYGARIVAFGGWEMPVQFSGIIEEHQAVRTRAGLFDASHMGEIWVDGPGALAAVQMLTINDASVLADGRVQYSAMANGEGGLVDDVTLFRFSPQRYMLCVNAANIEKDLRWIKAHTEGLKGVRVSDRSAETALLALQGPSARDILGRLTYAGLDELPYFHFVEARTAGMRTVISRTGYTGEDGFELFVDMERGPDLWEEIMAIGDSLGGLLPCGLGARDTLRLEMGYLLYGQDIDDTTSPLEAGLGWITRLDKGDFIGREAILRQKQEGVSTRLAGFVAQGKGVPRHGYLVVRDGQPVGSVTSGTMSPSLKAGIGLGYVPAEAAALGVTLGVMVREKELKVTVIKPPFYRAGSIRKTKPPKEA